ncbi:hypothetical protein JCM3774_005424 [Rhodotorula dairenensis]
MRYGGYSALLLLYAIAATLAAATAATVVEPDPTPSLSPSAAAPAVPDTAGTPTTVQPTYADILPGSAAPASDEAAGQDVPSAETPASSHVAQHASTATEQTVQPALATAETVGTAGSRSSGPAETVAVATDSSPTTSSTAIPEASPATAEPVAPPSSSSDPAVAASTEQVPLVEIPPAPELLSFQEWRDRYVVQLDSAGARRTRKAAQRARQDAVGAVPPVYDGDAVDVGSLFVIDAAADPASSEGIEAGGTAGTPRVVHSRNSGGRGGGSGTAAGVVTSDQHGPAATTSDLASPLQPLPNVGSGGEDDPLVLLKDRSNYAAFECAAMVHRSSRQSKGASSILVEKKDRYMLTPCAAHPKFVDVELCDEIQIDTLVLANFEFFSSTFKHFRASCSVDYPGKPADWHDLGTYRAQNARGVQVFKPLRNPHFCRYVRIDFLSHYGSEYYCPVSLLRVYGFTQLDAYRESERKAKALEEALAAADLIEEQEHLDVQSEDDMVLLSSDASTIREVAVDVNPTMVTSASHTQSGTSDSHPHPAGPPAGAVSTPTSPVVEAASTSLDSARSSSKSTETALTAPPNQARDGASILTDPTPTNDDSPPLSTASTAGAGSSRIATTIHSSLPTTVTSVNGEGSHESAFVSLSVASPALTTASSANVSSQDSGPSVRPVSSAPEGSAIVGPATALPDSDADTRSAVSSAAPTSVSASVPASSSTAGASPSANIAGSPVRVPATAETVVPLSSHVPIPAAPPPPPPPRPPILQQPQPGESIYGTIMKRLTTLEHNQTIAMYFTEAQSSMLRDAFGRVERRLHDIELTRGRQEQSIRQAILDLEKQRIEIDRERLALSTQVGLLAQEVRFGKRLTIAQLVGVFALIIFVGFTRGLPTSPFLHLASAAQVERGVGLRWRRDRRDRGSSVDDEPPRAAVVQLTADEGPPRKSHRSSPSTSLSRNGDGSMKRRLSLSKPTPRRHYAVGSAYAGGSRSGLLRALDLSKASSRPRTPPMRHSSAPPEEVPAGVGSALDTRDALRRRGVGSKTGGPSYRFPPSRDAPLPPPSLVRADSALSEQSESTFTADLVVPFPTPAAGGAPFPSPGEEADSEREILLPVVAELGSPSLSSVNGFMPSASGDDDGGYCTYSSNDELSPARNRDTPRPRLVTEGLLGSPGPSPSSPRPPKPQIEVRPATSMGFMRPQVVAHSPSGSYSRHRRTATLAET